MRLTILFICGIVVTLIAIVIFIRDVFFKNVYEDEVKELRFQVESYKERLEEKDDIIKTLIGDMLDNREQ